MNWQEFIDRLDLDDERAFNQEIDDVTFRDLHSFVAKRQWMLAVIRDLSKLELSTEASVIAGLQETRTQMPVHLDRRPDGPVAN